MQSNNNLVKVALKFQLKMFLFIGVPFLVIMFIYMNYLQPYFNKNEFPNPNFIFCGGDINKEEDKKIHFDVKSKEICHLNFYIIPFFKKNDSTNFTPQKIKTSCCEYYMRHLTGNGYNYTSDNYECNFEDVHPELENKVKNLFKGIQCIPICYNTKPPYTAFALLSNADFKRNGILNRDSILNIINPDKNKWGTYNKLTTLLDSLESMDVCDFKKYLSGFE